MQNPIKQLPMVPPELEGNDKHRSTFSHQHLCLAGIDTVAMKTWDPTQTKTPKLPKLTILMIEKFCLQFATKSLLAVRIQISSYLQIGHLAHHYAVTINFPSQTKFCILVYLSQNRMINIALSQSAKSVPGCAWFMVYLRQSGGYTDFIARVGK